LFPGSVLGAGDTVRDVEPGSRDYLLADHGQRSLHRVLDELTATFAVTGDRRPRSLRRTWLDTFDWRLYRAGLTLEHVTARGASELTRTGPDGLRLTAKPGQVRWPALAGVLPPGPLRDRVARVSGIRALLPVATAASQTRELRLLNEDEKTVARLVVDAASLPAPAGTALPTRLSVTEVRGYQAAARRARRTLDGVPGLTLSPMTPLDAALRAAGRQAADFSGKVDVALRPAMPARDAVATILLQQLDIVERCVDGVLRDIDTEFLHDLRVAVRRTRSALKLVGDVLPGELTLRFASEFRWLGDVTTPVRDLDVHLLSFPPMAARLVAAAPTDLDPFQAFLARRRAAERRKLNRALRSERFASVAGDWRKALLAAQDARRVPPGPRAADLSAARTRRAYGRVIKLGSAITAASPAESLHTLRKRCKELRYVLEFFASLHDPSVYRAVLGDLKRLQDCLGEFQDSQVQREEIQALAATMLAQRAAPAPALLAMGELAAQLGVRQRKARAEFAERFAGFAGGAGRRRIAALTAAAAS
jgi:CHAD domain-containing protein